VRIAGLAGASFKTALNKFSQRNWLSVVAAFALADEQLAAMVIALQQQIQEALTIANGENAKLISAQAEPAAKEWIAPAPGAPYRKANPLSSRRELEYAREYASRRRAALKAQRSAAAAPEPPNEPASESDV